MLRRRQSELLGHAVADAIEVQLLGTVGALSIEVGPVSCGIWQC